MIHTLLYVLCRSGTEEEYTALQQLLEDIVQYMHDMAGLKENQKAAKKRKAEEEKRKGEVMRQAAMERLSSRCLLL